jgi:hypothetical protein
LLRAGANVTAVERDRRCLPALAELAEAFPGQLRVIEGDAMKIDPAQEIGAPFHIVSNLPYNVGTALAVGWLGGDKWPPAWKSLTLMFQREVADRIVAKAGHRRLWTTRHIGPMAVRGPHRDAGTPQRLYPAPQGDVGGRAPDAQGAARGRANGDA